MDRYETLEEKLSYYFVNTDKRILINAMRHYTHASLRTSCKVVNMILASEFYRLSNYKIDHVSVEVHDAYVKIKSVYGNLYVSRKASES